MEPGWRTSAAAWIASMGPGGRAGDRGRRYVLDPAFERWIAGRHFATALDVGCGEGRLCRWLRARGVEATGLDPTPELLDEARRRDPAGRYILAGAEAMPVPDGAFDLVVTCLSLIDIADYRAAIAGMARALAPGGTLLVANLTDFCTAGGAGLGWMAVPGRDGAPAREVFAIDSYLEERAEIASWKGISVINHHRPLHAYLQAFLEAGLILAHYDVPVPVEAPPDYLVRYCRAPWFVVMSWTRPPEPHR